MIIPDKLLNSVKNNNLILFIGAGCSMPLGFPSWKTLALKMLEELDKDYGNSSDLNFKNIIGKVKDDSLPLLDALNKIEDDSNGEKYKAHAKKSVNEQITRINFGETSVLHPLLWNVSTKIITTNYDKVIEHFIPDDIKNQVKVFTNDNSFQAYKSHAPEGKFLYKIHGDIDNPDTLILFDSDYKTIYNPTNHNHNTFSSFIKDKTILFVGFSLADPYVTTLLKYVDDIYHGYSDTHYILTTKNEDFTKYNVISCKIDNWDGALVTFLEKLQSSKINSPAVYSAPIPIVESTDIQDDEYSKIIDLIKKKTEEIKKDPKKRELIAEIDDLRTKADKLLFGDLDFYKTINTEYKNSSLHNLFDKIYSSKDIDAVTFSKVQEIRNDKINYKWYERSVIISALTCSLIHFNNADDKKIILLIDFCQDNEDKVWQKAITYLFMALNHLGNKWLRPSGLKERIKSLTQNNQIQEALSKIIMLFYLDYHRHSYKDNLFDNHFFKEAYNYFMPFFEDNISLNNVYDNYNRDGIEKFIDGLIHAPILDQIKYLICENKLFDAPEKITLNILQLKFIKLSRDFYPFSSHIQELIIFYRQYSEDSHKKILNYQLRITNNSIKDYLLSESQKYRALAMHFMAEEDFVTAIHNWNEFLKLQTNDIEGVLNLTSCYFSVKKYKDALRPLLDLEKINPDNNRLLTFICDCYDFMGKYKMVILYADKLMELDESNDAYYVSKTRALFNLEQYFDALDNINIAIELNNANALALRLKGNTLNRIGKYSEALVCFNDALKIDPNDALIYEGISLCYYKIGNYSLALENINQSIKLQPNNTSAYAERVDIKLELGLFDQAFIDILEINKNDIKDSPVYARLSNYYRRTNEFDKAFNYLEKAIELDRSTMEFVSSSHSGSKAAIYASMGDEEMFYKYFEESLANGARAEWFYNDVKQKYRNEPRFIELLKKYNQTISSF